MTTLINLLHSLGAWSLPALWLPVLAWTLAALAALAALRLWKPHPLVAYRARQALLFALPLGLALAAATNASLWPALASEVLALPPVVFSPAETVPVATSQTRPAFTLWHGLGVLTLAAFLLAAWQLARFAASAVRLARFRRALIEDVPASVRRAAETAARRQNVRRGFRLVLAPEGTAPATIGPARPTIVLPRGLEGEHLRMALAHELVHVRRRDDQAAWGEALTGALFFVHPLCTLLRRHIADAREQACDAALLQERTFSARRYARLLYDFAQPTQTAALALPLSELSSPLKNRLHTMKRLSSLPSDRSVLTLAVALLLCVAAGLVACSDSVTPRDAPQETAQAQDAPRGPEAVPFATIQEKPALEGGQQTLYDEMRYPEAAKEQGLEGTVFLRFVVTKDGQPSQVEVLRGPAEVLNQEAVRALEAQRFEPGRQDGKAVPVKMSQPIRFQLQ